MADEESEKIIKMYEEMFSDRYTEEDPDYKKAVTTPIPHPPCITGYYIRPKRNFDGNRGGRGGGHWGNRGGGQDWNRNQHDGNQHNQQGYNRSRQHSDQPNRHSHRDRNHEYRRSYSDGR